MPVQMSYEIDRICACEYLEEKGGRCVVRIVRTSKDGGFKEMDFEVDDMRRASGFIVTFVASMMWVGRW